MLGRFEAHVLPALAAVVGSIDTIAVADASLAVVFSSANPDHVWILGIENHRADGIGAFVVEHRCPGCPRVGRLPDAARSGSHEELTPVIGIDREAHHAAGS